MPGTHLQLPWLMLNVKDPSQKQIMSDIWSKDGINSSQTIESISASIIVTNSQKEIEQCVPSSNGVWINYAWDNWEEPSAKAIISGIEAMHMVKKGQLILQDKSAQNQVKIICKLVGIAA